jgi:hypothetical protein
LAFPLVFLGLFLLNKTLYYLSKKEEGWSVPSIMIVTVRDQAVVKERKEGF